VSNARIQPTGRHRTKPSILRMKDKLIPVGWNELLDFVRRDHSSSPDPLLLILSSNSPNAAGDASDQRINARRWRGLRTFKPHLHSTTPAPLKIQDDWFKTLTSIIQQESNAAIHPPAANMESKSRAIAGRVQSLVGQPDRREHSSCALALLRSVTFNSTKS
jgi:hypothetical protein